MNEGIDRMIADLETPVVRQGWTVRILKGTGLALWALLLLVCYNFGVMRVAEWAEERFGTPPWPFVVVFGPLLLPFSSFVCHSRHLDPVPNGWPYCFSVPFTQLSTFPGTRGAGNQTPPTLSPVQECHQPRLFGRPGLPAPACSRATPRHFEGLFRVEHLVFC